MRIPLYVTSLISLVFKILFFFLKIWLCCVLVRISLYLIFDILCLYGSVCFISLSGAGEFSVTTYLNNLCIFLPQYDVLFVWLVSCNFYRSHFTCFRIFYVLSNFRMICLHSHRPRPWQSMFLKLNMELLISVVLFFYSRVLNFVLFNGLYLFLELLFLFLCCFSDFI